MYSTNSDGTPKPRVNITPAKPVAISSSPCAPENTITSHHYQTRDQRPHQAPGPNATVVAEPGLALGLQLSGQPGHGIGQARLIIAANLQGDALLIGREQVLAQVAITLAEIVTLTRATGQGKTAAARLVFEMQMLADRHIGEPYTERPRRLIRPLQPAMPEVAGLHRAHALRGLEQRDDQALLRVTADP